MPNVANVSPQGVLAPGPVGHGRAVPNPVGAGPFVVVERLARQRVPRNAVFIARFRPPTGVRHDAVVRTRGSARCGRADEGSARRGRALHGWHLLGGEIVDHVLAARAEIAVAGHLFAIEPAASALPAAGRTHGDGHAADAFELDEVQQ